ncbi:MAG: glycosyltransferase family 1 protein [Planctomycetes bacterium]|nr:glycosyltransferase family 1 protein [Planctomycetota bacterium]
MSAIARLRNLARNLYWTWHPELIGIFRDLDPVLWREAGHNPIEFLRRLDVAGVEDKTVALALDARISQAFHQMQEYLGQPDTWGARNAGALRTRPVAYFSAEFGLHESLPLYSGGLGVLAGDHLKSASDLGVPLVGVGLFYAEGYFRQRLDDEGWQQEDFLASQVEHLPLDRARDANGDLMHVRVRTRDAEIRAGIWFAQVGRNRLILLDTDVQGNAEENRRLTSQLYGGGPRTRIRQELVLGVGGMHALNALGIRPGVVHLNEGHSAFATLEMARQLMQREGRTFRDVRQKVAAMTVFTSHTPVAAGHDRFDSELVEETLGPLREQLGLTIDELLALGRTRGDDRSERFCMTVVGLRMSQYRNGVSARHGQVTRSMWRGLWPNLPQDMVPIGHITNGVHTASWLAVTLAPLYDRYLGADWRERIDDPRLWDAVERIDDAEFWEQHQILHAHLIEYVRRRLRRQGQPGDEASPPGPDPKALTLGFARRFAPYKRADLLLYDPPRLARILANAERPVQVIYAGKAHPENHEGKKLIQRIVQLMREEPFAGRMFFIEDHDMNVSRHLVQGTDVWLNTPRRPYEACGTSGQKALLNGCLNLSILDGWWAQAYDGRNGFAIGSTDEHADEEQQDSRDAGSLYEVLEREVIPLFYDRDARGVPHGWVARQKWAIRSLAWQFSARRMIMDYTRRCYLPAVGADVASPLSGALTE